MQKSVLILILFIIGFGLHAQDYLSVPSSNPNLFYIERASKTNDKIQIQEDSLIYFYDTLELPFIDDFSIDHFPKRIESTVDFPNLEDTLLYSILINNLPYRDTVGFVLDSTFIYSLQGDSIIGRIPTQQEDIQFANIKFFPTSYSQFTAFPPYDIYDTVNGGEDTVWRNAFYLSDSASFYFVPPNKNDFYTDRSVYRNTTFALNPPSIGVATFDGLDEFGLPYDLISPRTVLADFLTSKPINLSNLPDQNVFFSFFFQPKGLSIDAPEQEDSLVLQFFNPQTDKWGNIWDTSGFESDTFIQQIIQVPAVFFQNGFRFRFKNYANSSGAFDQWHLDYIYLNHGRSINDTVYNDIAYLSDGPSLLKDFTAMPWFHFRDDPSRYLVDTLRTFVVNSADESRSVYNKVTILDTINNTSRFQFPADNNQFVVFPKKRVVDFRYPFDKSIYTQSDIDSSGVFEATYDIDFRPTPSEDQDFIRSNDTVIGKTILKDYYAYDDGTAEAGYGINPVAGSAFMAVQFEIPFQDTIGGIDIYFLPQEVDIQNQNFELMVWNDLNPNGIIFSKAIKSKPVYSDDNAFITYYFDSLIVVNQTFYVGLRMVGPRSLNVGYDLNINNKNKVFWSFDGLSWNNPSNGIQDGSLMFRPIFRKKYFGVGINEIQQPILSNQFQIYPNPTNGILNIVKLQQLNIDELQVFDLSGRIVFQQNYSSTINVSHLKEGLYFLRLISIEGVIVNKKFLIAH